MTSANPPALVPMKTRLKGHIDPPLNIVLATPELFSNEGNHHAGRAGRKNTGVNCPADDVDRTLQGRSFARGLHRTGPTQKAA